ncbi:hypothetical protein DE146DRAFT_279090 [Phaeosphaeria sp. MPI-PUGE-AT-0046c]|nr:hypothetical protein DE146DRAFT_279090 [Phaeosphaeria sp. MPI-PUGE-AT-0046c]
MSPPYNIAIIGGSGTMGSHMLASLLSSPYPHSITVLSRASSTATFPPSVSIAKVDYDSPTSITSALTGIDFLVITLAATAPPELHTRIVNAAAAAGVKYIMPNYFAYAIDESRLKSSERDPIHARFLHSIEDVKNAPGDVHLVALACGFWYEWSLGLTSNSYGFDIAARKVTLYDDGTKKINTSTFGLCGDAVAAVLEQDLEDWKDKAVYVSSFLVSQRDMLDSLHRVLGTSDKDWEISYQGAKERYEEGLAEMQKGDRSGFAKAMYARVFFPESNGDFETGHGTDNEKLGLKKESLDEATKRTVKMVEKGFNYQTWRETGRITRVD